ncbi:DUF397 domain-containing protein [Streptomyces sp. NBC_01619]|uniref:DUF397 domain-containing protein n=1 Tax=Streptomyces pratisoli TaxID=3139917 RepID=A0ACC6QG98_9ACTN|nr:MULTISPECIES: DUF397 domain-containing protein [unclassified Streptomyces]MCX4508842.1 DUF397 domain-containing protein [Streptomyces sp. NBC_01619]
MDRDDIQWFKSSYSGGSGTECVEVARIAGGTAVRDSKDPLGPLLAFPAEAWNGFTGAVRDGDISC